MRSELWSELCTTLSDVFGTTFPIPIGRALTLVLHTASLLPGKMELFTASTSSSVCQFFSGYKLGQPVPSQYEAFCDEVAAKAQDIADDKKCRAGGMIGYDR